MAERDEKSKDADKRLKARQASEKELQGWIRMALTLVTTGLGFERGLTFLSEIETSSRIDPGAVLRTLSLALMVLGLVALCLAYIQHFRLMRACRRDEPLPDPLVSIGSIVASGILAIFLLALITVIVNRDVIKRERAALDTVGRASLVESSDPAGGAPC